MIKSECFTQSRIYNESLAFAADSLRAVYSSKHQVKYYYLVRATNDPKMQLITSQFFSSGSKSPPVCICLYIHCQFSGLTSPPRARTTAPPLQDPTLQQSSRQSPFTNPYKKPLAKRSPAPVASTAWVSPIAGTRTT